MPTSPINKTNQRYADQPQRAYLTSTVTRLIASTKRAAKRLAKRALLTNVYVYRKGRTEAKAKATHTYSGLTKIRRLAKAEPEIPWSNMWTTGMGEGILGVEGHVT